MCYTVIIIMIIMIIIIVIVVWYSDNDNNHDNDDAKHFVDIAFIQNLILCKLIFPKLLFAANDPFQINVLLCKLQFCTRCYICKNYHVWIAFFCCKKVSCFFVQIDFLFFSAKHPFWQVGYFFKRLFCDNWTFLFKASI